MKETELPGSWWAAFEAAGPGAAVFGGASDYCREEGDEVQADFWDWVHRAAKFPEAGQTMHWWWPDRMRQPHGDLVLRREATVPYAFHQLLTLTTGYSAESTPDAFRNLLAAYRRLREYERESLWTWEPRTYGAAVRDLYPKFAGKFTDSYTLADVDSVAEAMWDHYSLPMICVWEYEDQYGPDGESWFCLVTEGGYLAIPDLTDRARFSSIPGPGFWNYLFYTTSEVPFQGDYTLIPTADDEWNFSHVRELKKCGEGAYSFAWPGSSVDRVIWNRRLNMWVQRAELFPQAAFSETAW